MQEIEKLIEDYTQCSQCGLGYGVLPDRPACTELECSEIGEQIDKDCEFQDRSIWSAALNYGSFGTFGSIQGTCAEVSGAISEETEGKASEEVKGGDSSVVKMVFYGDVNDFVFLKWNYKTNKPEILVYPNQEIKSGVASYQKWTSTALPKSSFVSAGMNDLDMNTINGLLSAKTPLEFRNNIVTALSLSESYIVGDLKVGTAETYSASTYAPSTNGFLDIKFKDTGESLIIPEASKTEFQYIETDNSGMGIGSTIVCLRYNTASGTWLRSSDSTYNYDTPSTCTAVWPGEWSSGLGIDGLDKTNFEVGYLYLTYVYTGYTPKQIQREVKPLLVQEEGGLLKIYKDGKDTNLYLKKETSVVRVYNSDFGADTLVGGYQYQTDKSIGKFQSRVSAGNSIYDKDPSVFKALQEATLVENPVDSGKFVFQ